MFLFLVLFFTFFLFMFSVTRNTIKLIDGINGNAKVAPFAIPGGAKTAAGAF